MGKVLFVWRRILRSVHPLDIDAYQHDAMCFLGTGFSVDALSPIVDSVA